MIRGAAAGHIPVAVRERFGVPIRDRRFWAIQALIVIIAAADLVTDARVENTAVSLAVVTLFFVPVTYAAVAFDFRRAAVTALWCVAVDLPVLLIEHRGAARMEQLFLLSAIVSAGVYVAHWIEREAAARTEYARAVVRGQEDERRRLAQDLHDETIQQLMIHCRVLDDLKRAVGTNDDAMTGVQNARSSAERIIQQLRERIRALRPAVLDDLGLVAAVEQVVSRYHEHTGALVEFQVRGTPCRLAADAELGLFRIAQEAVRNAERHAAATRLSVKLRFSDAGVRLCMTDNGAGFSLEGNPDLAAEGHLGLLGMRERARLLNGRLEIVTAPYRGTEIHAWIPS